MDKNVSGPYEWSVEKQDSERIEMVLLYSMLNKKESIQ